MTIDDMVKKYVSANLGNLIEHIKEPNIEVKWDNMSKILYDFLAWSSKGALAHEIDEMAHRNLYDMIMTEARKQSNIPFDAKLINK